MSRIVEIIKPTCAKGESIGFGVSVALVLLIWTFGVYGRTRIEAGPEMQSWQLNVFEDLNSKEQGLYTDLTVAAEEIYQIYVDEGSEWCSLRELEDYGLPPFVKDITWKQRGSILWKSKSVQTDVKSEIYYLGSPDDVKITGAFLLSIHKDNNINEDEAHEVWFKQGKVYWPDSFSDSFLISDGWKQLVAYRGDDEIARIRETLQ